MPRFRRQKTKERERTSPYGLVIFFLAVIAIYFLYPFILDTVPQRERQLSAYSNEDSWNGLSSLRQKAEDLGYDTRSILSQPQILDEVEDPERTLLIITGVEQEYGAKEVQALIDFVDAGGAVIMCDDHDYANSISDDVFGIYFYGSTLWDENFRQNTSFVNRTVYFPINGSDPAIFNVLMNDPTGIDSFERGTPLINSSDEAWIDTNGNGHIDTFDRGAEKGKPIEMAVMKGRAVFIGDASIFINQMWDKLQNADFAEFLMEYFLPDGGLILFEESRHAPTTFSEGLYKSISGTVVYFFASPTLGFGLIFTIIINLVIVSRVVKDPEYWQHTLTIDEHMRGNLAFYRHQITGLTGGNPQERMRSAFLQKVTVTAGIPPDRFAKMTPADKRKVLGDDALYRLISSDKQLSSAELATVAGKISRWGK